MRNLKRALSLLLAAAMLIGMMVVGASAAGSLDDFSDKDEIVNQDAVSLLTILGVIEGKEDGSFYDPTGNVTRAEMAKMIATILNQGADIDGLYVGMNTGLTDVSGHWAESYINYCYSLGIIAGRGNGTFDPGANVTGTEAAKMLLVAAGYDASIEGMEGADWAIRTAALASTLGIFDNLNAPTGDPLNRDNAALLVYNALDVEMIQRYDNGYAIVYGDYRTLLSDRYGVYRLQGVVVGNEWAQLMTTNSDAALAEGKTRLSDIRLIESDTVSTRPNGTNNPNNGTLDGQPLVDTTFNVSTPVEYLGRTVTMYVRNTTVLANSEVLGVYLKEGENTVITSVDNEDQMEDFLKGTGLKLVASADATDDVPATEFYVNYGYVRGDETDATTEMDFGKVSSHLDNLDVATDTTGNANGYGIEMTVIDNDQDGNVDYVLYLQETLSHVISKSSARETTTIQAFNNNAAIDDADIVTEADIAENDLVLVTAYGGRYYVSEPEVVTGQMDDFTTSKTDEQTITISGTEYNPSYIQYEAFTADNTYEFDINLCDRDEDWTGYYTEGVQFDTDYDFILDSNGNVIAFQPSELGLYDYALVLDSGYIPGAFASDVSGKVNVLLPDGTEGTYTLNFSASARNVGEQIAEYYENDGDPTTSAAYTTNMGIQQLKGFLGTGDSDNSSTAPWGTAVIGSANAFAGKDIDGEGDGATRNDYRDGNAKGYVIGYSLNSDNELTITSIVGTNQPLNDVTYKPADFADKTAANGYDSGAGRLRFTPAEADGTNQLAIDLRTVAFYYDVVDLIEMMPVGAVVGSTGYQAGDKVGDYTITADDVTAGGTGNAKYVGSSYDVGDVLYGVAVGYNEMTDIDSTPAVDFQANAVRNTNLASVVLFEEEGAQAEKDYVFVLSYSNVSGTRANLNVVFMDGTVGEITIDTEDYNRIFRNNDAAWGMAYAYTTDSNGVSELTVPDFSADANEASNLEIYQGYAWQLRSGTLELYRDNGKAQFIDTFSYSTQIWNVEGVGSSDTNANSGAFSTNVGAEVVLVVDTKDATVRAAFITDILDGMYLGAFRVNVTGTTVAANGGVVATATPTIPTPAGANDSYEWFIATSSTDETGTSLIGDARFTGANSKTLSLVANRLPEGPYYFFVKVTRSQAGMVDRVVSSAGETGDGYTPTLVTVTGSVMPDFDTMPTIAQLNAALQQGDVTVNTVLDPAVLSDTGDLVIPTGRTLTLNYAFTANGDITNNGTLIAKQGIAVGANKLTNSTGAVIDVTGDLDASGANNAALAFTNQGTIRVSGELTAPTHQTSYTGTYDVGTLTVDSTNGATFTVYGTLDANTLDASAGSTSVTPTVVAGGSLTVDALGTNVTAISAPVNNGGTLVIPSASGLTMTAGTTTIAGNVSTTVTVSGGTMSAAAVVGAGSSLTVSGTGEVTVTGDIAKAVSVSDNGKLTAGGDLDLTLTLSDDAEATVGSVTGAINDGADTTLTVTGAQTLVAPTTVNGTMTFEGALTAGSYDITVAAGGALTLNGAVDQADHVKSTASDNTGTVTFGAEPTAATTLSNWQIDGSAAPSKADLNGKTFTANTAGNWTYTSV